LLKTHSVTPKCALVVIVIASCDSIRTTPSRTGYGWHGIQMTTGGDECAQGRGVSGPRLGGAIKTGTKKHVHQPGGNYRGNPRRTRVSCSYYQQRHEKCMSNQGSRYGHALQAGSMRDSKLSSQLRHVAPQRQVQRHDVCKSQEQVGYIGKGCNALSPQRQVQRCRKALPRQSWLNRSGGNEMRSDASGMSPAAGTYNEGTTVLRMGAT